MKHHQLNVVTFILYSFGLSGIVVVQAEQTQYPFYIIAHMANSGPSLDWSVSQGANAIENDLRFDVNGNPTIFEHGGICDCICDIGIDRHICQGGLSGECSGSPANENAAAHMQHVARLSGIVLYFIDSKVEEKWTTRLIKAGTAVVPFLDTNLFGYGYKGKVVIGCGRVKTYDYLQAAVTAANKSPNRDRYFFSFDQEGDDYQGTVGMLSLLTKNRVYGTGISSCSPATYYDGITKGVTGRKNGEVGMTYIWSIDKESSMREYINRGVQGIMTNRPGLARDVAMSMGLNIAKPSTDIPVSTSSVPAPNKCDCDYHPGGCKISWPAPAGQACKCKYKGAWTCGGSTVSCSTSNEKCSRPDGTKEACQLGGGDCDAYTDKNNSKKRMLKTNMRSDRS